MCAADGSERPLRRGDVERDLGRVHLEPEAQINNFSLSDIELNGFYLPGGDTVTPVQMLQLVGGVSTGPLSVTRNDEEVIGIESMESASTFEPAQGSGRAVWHTTRPE